MLTDIKIRQAKSRDKTYKLADGRGLYIEVSTNGSKYWRYKYRVTANGKRREKRLSLGVKWSQVQILPSRPIFLFKLIS